MQDINLCEGNVHERVRRIAGLLEEMYGDPPRRREDPLDALIATVLSQNTSDVNSHRAFATLKARFPSWEDVRKADVSEVAEAIKSGGLGAIKAARIQRILERIYDERGQESLEFLRECDIDKAQTYLKSLDGVGPKTAACVLLFGCERLVFPVDTHVLRISKRLGLIAAEVGAEAAHDVTADIVPPELAYSLHVNMIAHGRQRCRPQNPRCGGCLLTSECAHWEEKALL